MKNNAIKNIRSLGFQWATADPFLFCVHHEDFYPAGNGQFGPAASLQGRMIGQDFTVKDGWRMYHGTSVPGFPVHPHRGFETVTIVRRGFVDHADSLGASGRYSAGDVQWMTAGRGIQHAEMFPLLNQDKENTLELFQIWLNLPKIKKFAEPEYKMFWNESVPVATFNDKNGKLTEVTVIAGALNDTIPLIPPSDSWAADPGNKVSIWLIRMEQGSAWTLPEDEKGLNRKLYFFKGSSLITESKRIPPYHAVDLYSENPVELVSDEEEIQLLLLQGRPIEEPVIQYGPFVMNTKAEIQQAFDDYRRTQFGGWPWQRNDPVHPEDKSRFARFTDGREEIPGKMFQSPR